MARLKIFRSPATENDLIDIWCSIAPDSPAAADRVLDHISERILQLADFPESGPARPEIAEDARALSVANYLVLYRIFDERIEIIRVVHGARDVEALF
ncbi:type II toxin-antitoxin system RelE/ParE family toxin [Mesorhizobium sp. SB112]|uniref:type II toxin-antitoxin system RelE/ParE family toxin n=1 Tax=Mesorhizobium sp. SB112 TaxID=3151853 RepID=UPI003263C69A